MAEKAEKKGEKEKEKKGFLKPGKIVIIVTGRFAGKKAIIVKTFDDGTPERKFGHALVAGIERGPLAVSKSMSKKKILKRSKVKPFLKYINFNHMMPTRYTANDIDLRTHVTQANVKKVSLSLPLLIPAPLPFLSLLVAFSFFSCLCCSLALLG